MKLASGIMVGLVGYSLEWSAFDREALEQSDRVKDTMIFLMGGIPLFCYGIGSLAFTRFSLTETEHARIRTELVERARESARPHHS
jgi:Na+/melibiose symporter-like transporter